MTFVVKFDTYRVFNVIFFSYHLAISRFNRMHIYTRIYVEYIIQV